MNLPEDLANRVLDAIGSEIVIGDMQEGTREAQVLLRSYGECLRQLLRAARWNFARKDAPLVLLADSSGQTPNVGTKVPQPWIYEYEYPIDCMKARFVPWNYASTGAPVPPNNIVNPWPVPPGLSVAPNPPVQRPAPFVEAMDVNYAPPEGTLWWEVQGVSPAGRTVILTNVQCAQLVYTAYIPYPSMWDSQFRAALVAYLASEVALALSKDKKFGLTLRGQNIAIAKQKIAEARISDGNEGMYSVKKNPDWMRVRNTGGGRWGGDEWGGGWYGGCGYDNIGFSDGSYY